MTDAQQREAARQFYYKWNGKGREDEDARSYWIDVLQNILGVEGVTDRVDFEKKVVGADGNTKRIDVYIPETHVLIEQKSLGIALDKPQTGHDGMTPYEQAKYYDNYPNSLLADLYEPLTTPDALRRAHQANDRAVMTAYGMPIGRRTKRPA